MECGDTKHKGCFSLRQHKQINMDVTYCDPNITDFQSCTVNLFETRNIWQEQHTNVIHETRQITIWLP